MFVVAVVACVAEPAIFSVVQFVTFLGAEGGVYKSMPVGI